MARLPNAFNAANHEKLGDFKAIPAGTYLAEIVKSELKSTKSGDGAYLQFSFKVLEGEHMGKTLFARLNIQNQNAQTVEIAQKSLATICECVGVSQLVDTEELHGRPMYISVTVREKTAQYPEQNDIKGYAPATGAPPVAIGAAPAPGKPVPPWQQKK